MSNPVLDPAACAAALQQIPYVRFLGARAEVQDGALILILPFAPHLVGNPFPAALHGGVLGALLEITAIAQVKASSGALHNPKPIDVSIDYLRGGRTVDTYARAELTRLGRRIANVRAEAWQTQRSEPIAILHGNFLLRSDDA
jgi:uncharacterized protein (TIGR00369 family)